MSRRIRTASTQYSGKPLAVEEVAEIDFTQLSKGSTFTTLSNEEFRLPYRKVTAPSEFSIAQPEKSGYFDRLIGYIPAEVVALYLGVSKMVPVREPNYWTALWIIAAFSALCVPLYMYFAIQETGKPTLWEQIIISTIAFPIWIFAIGGPFRSFSWYDEKQWIAAILISFFTFLAGLYKPKPDLPIHV